ncbi:hypothetical protein C7451_10193 [Blastomonas natatoria]|uniref:BMFP domain-containing protein YqiC n=1 Tax=Blastomonas natatoria TaxID=34015 RepID=A0A2V3VDX5_9SPHN|nr:accessory factor UbiK family protein [Blastomonas natatoria]PXW79031.1 hypothetical protein C7451_10193 [Blastomonas natatoria]
MQNKSEFGGDFAKFINGLAGTVACMSREAGESARERTREWIAGLDFVSREEFDAVKEMAAKAREEADSLKARVAALESALATKGAGEAE